MILVIVNNERDSRTGRTQQVVSHGVEIDSGRIVILPNDSPEDIGAVFDAQLSEYVLN